MSRIEATTVGGGAAQVLGQMRTCVKEADTTRRILPQKFDSWKFTRSAWWDYDKEFEDLVYPQTLQSLLTEKKKQGRPVKALDVMSYGHALHSFVGLDHGLSVGLSNNNGAIKTSDTCEFLEGNIDDPKTWESIHTWIRTLSPNDPTFDFIYVRPIGGFVSKLYLVDKRTSDVYELYFRMLYKLLSNNQGDAFIQVPDQFRWINGHTTFTNWIEGISCIDGLDVTMSSSNVLHTVIRVTKNEKAPKKLPHRKDQENVSEKPIEISIS